MKLAVMQPYLFPYLGYYQLINAIDKFVVYDDVSFIKQGWINRNRILLNGVSHIFTVPIKNISSFKNINETEIDVNNFRHWKSKFYKTLSSAYYKAPHYNEIKALIEAVFDSPAQTINEMASESILKIAEYLNLPVNFVLTSSIYNNSSLKGQERVLDICFQEKASVYINAAGGSELYSKKTFADNGICLKFISSETVKYQQFLEPFVPHLSIIDVLMFNSKDKVNTFLNCYELV